MGKMLKALNKYNKENPTTSKRVYHDMKDKAARAARYEDKPPVQKERPDVGALFAYLDVSLKELKKTVQVEEASLDG